MEVTPLVGALCCGGVVPIVLTFSFLVFLHLLIQKLTRKETIMEQLTNTNNNNACIFRFINSLFNTMWAIGTSVAAAGVQSLKYLYSAKSKEIYLYL